MALDQRIIDLYDEYTHRPLDRRVFLERLSAMAGSAGAAAAALAVLEPNYAKAALVPEADPRISVERVARTVDGTAIAGYLASPKSGGKRPAVIVIHENRGLNAHIEDVVRRYAAAGFIAFGPDLLLPLGGTPADADAARDRIAKLPGQDAVAQLRAAVVMLKSDPRANGQVGAVGFCWGGGMVNVLATREPGLGAGVVFYGVAPPAEAVPQIRAPLLVHLAALDARVNGTYPAYEAALKAAGKPYTIHMYEGVNHAFHNDTSDERYDKPAATLAFDRSVAFFKEKLGG
jgi:carboxymethylenebutenolidase